MSYRIQGASKPVALALSLLPPRLRLRWFWCRWFPERMNWPAGFAGFDHNTSHLKTLIVDARHLGRIPVLRAFHLDPKHNFGHLASGKLDDYFDLSRSCLLDKTTGNRHPLVYINEQELFALLRRKRQHSILRIPRRREVTERENDKYSLIVKETGGFHVIPEGESYRVILEDAVRIADYGDAVARQLGEFYALGYRHLKAFERKHLPARRKKYRGKLPVSRLAAELPGIFPPGSKLYVFSNIWNQPDYFRPLERHYKVFRYYDFPVLRTFIGGGGGGAPNTFMLYAIEQRIAKKAQKCFRVHWHPDKSGII